ncbi:hypothetical protein D0809_07935 [Flavobacterium circumlabens]|uniref:Lipoprotein n=1 Tax=Flavobacterium circumlabens TaxID=2133765 RepID=A0A4Y7UGT1_9FLAO|nr:hypothetical protein [Flavobacterium circumlabens]TCN59844.1 hypothetical protein EV142_102464 [Flavobacterium circumlabens]TEB45098.1 hypothetical protein D0809_07935 [Flavobacterium circumlabens]
MKKLMILGAFALLTTTLFSCTADELETPATKEVQKKINPVPSYADGPGDDPIPVDPPKK